jgi:hypothetical protein
MGGQATLSTRLLLSATDTSKPGEALKPAPAARLKTEQLLILEEAACSMGKAKLPSSR